MKGISYADYRVQPYWCHCGDVFAGAVWWHFGADSREVRYDRIHSKDIHWRCGRSLPADADWGHCRIFQQVRVLSAT